MKQDFTEIRAVGAQMFPEDRRTDMKTIISSFSNFENAPKKRHTESVHVLYSYICRRYWSLPSILV